METYELMPPGTRKTIKAAMEAMILCKCEDDDRERLDQVINALLNTLPPSGAAMQFMEAVHTAHKFIGSLPACDEGTEIYDRLTNALAPKGHFDA